MLITLGLGIAIVGIVLYFGEKIGIGRLPGDIYIRKGNFSFYFPIVTSILASILLTLILSFIKK